MLTPSEGGLRKRQSARSIGTLLVPIILLFAVLLATNLYQTRLPALVVRLENDNEHGDGRFDATDVSSPSADGNTGVPPQPVGPSDDHRTEGDGDRKGTHKGAQKGARKGGQEENREKDDEEDLAYEAPSFGDVPDKPVTYPEEWLLEPRDTFALVDRSLASFKKIKAFDATLEKLEHGFIVRVENGRVYAFSKMLTHEEESHHGHWNAMMRRMGMAPMELNRMLQPLCRHGILGEVNLDFFVSVPDEPVTRRDDEASVPAFSWVKTPEHTDLLIPYPYTYDEMYPVSFVKARAGVNEEDELSLEAFDAFCLKESESVVETVWDDKIPKGVWRGSTTGAVYTKENWRGLARPKVVKYCMEHEDLCDAAISGFVQADDDAIEEMTVELRAGDSFKMTSVEQGRYKYAILLDGNSAPSSRTVTNLGHASAILKQDSPYMEFYYHSLKPSVHYLPVSMDVEDVGEVIEWAKAHDEEVKRMVVRAMAFRCRWLHSDVVEQYIVDIFRMYVKRFDRGRASMKTEDMVPIGVNCGTHEYEGG